MAKILPVATTVLLLVSLATAVPHHRKQSNSFRLIPNSQFSCLENPLPGDQKAVQRYELKTADMMAILETYGGTYMKNFMAHDLDEARKHFPNLLDIPKKYKDMIYKANPDIDKGRILLKEDVLKYINSIRKADSSRHPVEDEASEKQSKPESVVEVVEQKHRVQRDVRDESKDFLATDQQVRNTHDGDLKRHEFFSKKAEHVKTNQKMRSKKPTDVRFPLVLPEAIGMKNPTRNNVNVTYCNLRGEDFVFDNNDVTRLCTVCHGVRTMPPGVWPFYMNTALCDINDSHCLDTLDPEYSEASVCGDNTIPLTMLCHVPDTCCLAEVNGETRTVYNFEPCTQYISLGCECYVLRDSAFYPYV